MELKDILIKGIIQQRNSVGIVAKEEDLNNLPLETIEHEFFKFIHVIDKKDLGNLCNFLHKEISKIETFSYHCDITVTPHSNISVKSNLHRIFYSENDYKDWFSNQSMDAIKSMLNDDSSFECHIIIYKENMKTGEKTFFAPVFYRITKDYETGDYNFLCMK